MCLLDITQTQREEHFNDFFFSLSLSPISEGFFLTLLLIRIVRHEDTKKRVKFCAGLCVTWVLSWQRINKDSHKLTLNRLEVAILWREENKKKALKGD